MRFVWERFKMIIDLVLPCVAPVPLPGGGA